MSKAKKEGVATPAVTDISHEEIKEPSNGVMHVAKVISPEEQLKTEIVKFNVSDSAIAAMKETYGGLKIAGPDDKDGYKKTREAWGEVRSTRTKLEKKGKELRDGYTVITKGIKKEEDRLIELLTPLEEQLYKEWKDIDEIKEQEKQAKIAAEEAALNARLEQLIALGLQFMGGMWQLGETISVDIATLRAMPDDQFEKLKAAAQAKAEELAQAKAAAEAEKQREADRLKKEQDDLKAEQEKMRKEREAMEKERQEMAEQKKAALLQRFDSRIARLNNIGIKNSKNNVAMVFDNGFTDYSFMTSDFSDLSNEDFEAFFSRKEAMVKEANDKKAEHVAQQKKELEALELRKKTISDRLIEVGLTYNYGCGVFEFRNDVLSLEINWNRLLNFDFAELNQFVVDAGASILTAKKAAEKAEQERQAAAEKEAKLGMSDKEKFEHILKRGWVLHGSISPDDFKTKTWKSKANGLQNLLYDLLKASE